MCKMNIRKNSKAVNINRFLDIFLYCIFMLFFFSMFHFFVAFLFFFLGGGSLFHFFFFFFEVGQFLLHFVSFFFFLIYTPGQKYKSTVKNEEKYIIYNF